MLLNIPESGILPLSTGSIMCQVTSHSTHTEPPIWHSRNSHETPIANGNNLAHNLTA